MALLDLRIERRGFHRRRRVDALGQDPTTGFILSERFPALTTQGQGAHELAVCFFARRIDGNLPPGIRFGLFIIALPFMVLSQLVKGRQRFLA